MYTCANWSKCKIVNNPYVLLYTLEKCVEEGEKNAQHKSNMKMCL